MWSESAPTTVRVLEADPELGTGIEAGQLPLASAAATAPAFEFERGPWNFFPPPERGALGALIVKGVMVVRIGALQRAHIELLTEGDVVSPWVGVGDDDLSLPSVVTATVVSPLRIALLDRRFVLRTVRWPEIQGALFQRLIVRVRQLSLQAAINALPRIEERLHATLWSLAYRLGRVTPQGTVLTLQLTHSQLAEMLGAQRPSVSMALGRMQTGGTVIRTGRTQWLLRGEPPSVLSRLALQAGVEA